MEWKGIPIASSVDIKAGIVDAAMRSTREMKGDAEIYFIHPMGTKWIKIGLARGITAARRLQTLQTAWPIPLELILAIPGAAPELERRLHLLFQSKHLRGDWFDYAPVIKQFIEAVEPIADERNREAFDLARRMTPLPEFTRPTPEEK